MLAGLDEVTLARLGRRVDALPALVTDDALARPEWRTVLARRLRKRADVLALEIERTGVLYDAHALHMVRIATKKLRYAVELAGELRLGATAAALRTLKRQQERLGDIHDLEVLMGFADHAVAEIPTRVRVARLVGDWQRECRELHARYLRSRAAVVRMTEYAGGGLALRVAGPRVRVAATTGERDEWPLNGKRQDTEGVTIYLVRHAIAAERGPDYPDDSRRPLTPKGAERFREAVAGLVAARRGDWTKS